MKPRPDLCDGALRPPFLSRAVTPPRGPATLLAPAPATLCPIGILRGELMAALAMRLTRKTVSSPPTLSVPVGNVLGVGSEKEVFGVDAVPHVAPVENVHSFRHRAVKERPRKAVRPFGPSGTVRSTPNKCRPVSVALTRPLPQPASVNNAHLSEEAFPWWLCNIHSGHTLNIARTRGRIH